MSQALKPPFVLDTSDVPHTIVVRDANGTAAFGICHPSHRERATAEFIVRACNAYPVTAEALLAVRAACRDPDTDTAMPRVTGELVEAALAAMGERS